MLVDLRRAASIPTARRSRRCSRSGACTTALVASRVRQDASLVVDTGDARDTHAVACLLGYGADAICPRVALAHRRGDGRRRPARRGPLVGGAGEAPGRDRGRRAQDHVEDGDLDRRRLPRRADLRGARARRRGRRRRACAARRRRSAASGSTRSAPTCSRATRPATRDDAGARRAGLHPLPQARRRVPREQPRGDRGAARVDRPRRRRPRRRRRRSAARTAPTRLGPTADAAQVRAPCPSAPAEEQGQVIFLERRRGPSRCPPRRPASTCAPRTCCRRAVTEEPRRPLRAASATLVEARPVTELHDLLELVPGGRAGAARRGRAGRGDHAPVLDRCDVARLAVGARRTRRSRSR